MANHNINWAAMTPRALTTRLKILTIQHLHQLALRRITRTIKALPPQTIPDRELLSALRRAWGNEGYSADVDYLAEVAKMAAGACGPVLECGTGLTTLILGLLAGRRGIHVTALEHLPEWHATIANALNACRISGVHIHIAALRDYEGFAWYDPPFHRLPNGFAHVVCDGPPEVTAGGRFGLLPVMYEHLINGATILLDDATTAIGSATLSRWQKEWGLAVDLKHTSEGIYAVAKFHK